MLTARGNTPISQRILNNVGTAGEIFCQVVNNKLLAKSDSYKDGMAFGDFLVVLDSCVDALQREYAVISENINNELEKHILDNIDNSDSNTNHSDSPAPQSPKRVIQYISLKPTSSPSRSPRRQQ